MFLILDITKSFFGQTEPATWDQQHMGSAFEGMDLGQTREARRYSS